MAHEKNRDLLLPVSIASHTDLSRVLREAKALDDSLHQATIRRSKDSHLLPSMSRMLQDVVDVNKLDLVKSGTRTELISFLDKVQSSAPVLHFSFSADPSPAFTAKLMTWLRKEIHPLVLIQVGLQPYIGAGCLLRTTNKQFDFSLRENFKKRRDQLISSLEDLPHKAANPHAAKQAKAAS